jgi:hypothetical protein
MSPIDQEFRPKKDFFVAWFLIAVAAVAIGRPWSFDLPRFSKVAWILVVPFILTFFIYGPVLLARQIIHSGTRGWLVFRTFMAVILGAGLILGVLHLAGLQGSAFAQIVEVGVTAFAIIVLDMRTGKRAANQRQRERRESPRLPSRARCPAPLIPERSP